MPALEILSVVALTEDLPEEKLIRGQVGTVVELLSDNLVLVEFADERGRTCALPAVTTNQLIRLHYAHYEQAA